MLLTAYFVLLLLVMLLHTLLAYMNVRQTNCSLALLTFGFVPLWSHDVCVLSEPATAAASKNKPIQLKLMDSGPLTTMRLFVGPLLGCFCCLAFLVFVACIFVSAKETVTACVVFYLSILFFLFRLVRQPSPLVSRSEGQWEIVK